MSTIDRLAPEEITRIDDDNRTVWSRSAATYASGFEELTGTPPKPRSTPLASAAARTSSTSAPGLAR